MKYFQKHFLLDFLTCVLISGGLPRSTNGKNVELFNLVTKKSCKLPELLFQQDDHISVDGLIYLFNKLKSHKIKR